MREILVQFREDVEAEVRLRVIEEAGGRLREEIVPQRISVVLCPEGISVGEMMERFRRSPVVAHVEPNRRVELMKGGISMRRDRGAIMLVALLGLTTVSVLAGAFIQMGFHDQRFSERSQAGMQAFYLSESAIDQGLNWLRGQMVPPQGTERVVLFGGQWQKLGDGVYLTTIDPDDNNPNTDVKRYMIEGWGVTGAVASPTVAGVLASPLSTRRNQMLVQTESFAGYAYFTNDERTRAGLPVWFISGDVIEGPTHTNGQFSMYGTPRFLGPVSSVARTIHKWGGDVFTKPEFKEPPKLGVAQKKFPTQMPETIINKAQQGGTYLKGDTSVTLMANGMMRVNNQGKDVISPLPANGVLYVDGGNVTLKGTLKGQLTVATSGDVRVVDSVTYATNPVRDSTSKDVLGIVAGQNVVVPKEAPHDLRIDASIMALNSSFGVENYWEGPPKGTLTINGGLIQANRGPVGRFSPSTGTKVSGYTKDYHYDKRLKGMAPPSFPTTGEYKTLVWQEVKS